MAGDICFVELKIRMRSPAEVLVWSVIISEVAVIGAVGYSRCSFRRNYMRRFCTM